ncbi:phosphotransferase [Rhizobium sp. AG855]|uniref:phosphotransferase n=1 Tax=Rhizobium sp. AG855 TaxID=2183898 RepID=UPI000FF1AA12|nr:phosphotransferase [Rhizobium sp. AG855]RKE85578.1 Ser/Thr protein kinase RdoA (MazF antagonist) [Rhizobium sp. AG855]
MIDIDIKKLSSRYGRSFTNIDVVVGGVNRTYRVLAGEDVFYLRLYRSFGRPLSQITAEASLLTRFPESPQVGVSRPVATTDGAYVIELSWSGERRHVCLFQGAEGEQFELNNIAHMERFGASIANLHLAMPAVTDGEVRELNPIAIVHDALHALREVPGSDDVVEAIRDEYLPSLLRLDLGNLVSGICHGDPWTGNARFQNGKTVFFDFDDFGHGPFVLDLSTAAWHFAHEESAQNDAMAKALIAGYEKVRPLSVPELEALPLFIKLDEVRSLLFLARYCALSDEMWIEAFEGAKEVFSQSQKS